jgi:hypothetical protein
MRLAYEMMLAYNMLLVIQLLLILKELLLMQMCDCGCLYLKLLYPFDDLDSMKSDSNSKVCLQVLISDMI